MPFPTCTRYDLMNVTSAASGFFQLKSISNIVIMMYILKLSRLMLDNLYIMQLHIQCIY